MENPTYRLVFDDFFDLVDDLESYAFFQGWEHIKEGTTGPHGHTYEIQWDTPDGDRVVFGYDLDLDVSFVDVRTMDRAYEMHDKMPAFTPDEILKRIEKSEDSRELVRLLSFAAVGMRRPDPEFLEGAVLLSNDDDPGFRFQAAFIMAYSELPEFRDRLVEMARSDPDEEIREQITKFVHALEEGWKEDGLVF